MKMSLSEISSCLNLPFTGENIQIDSVCLDSRKVEPGSMFVCIKGERSDGHDFVEIAEKNGARAILASRAVTCKTPVLISDDVVLSLGKIASAWRKKSKARVICVTGTAGKTTLKEILKSIFSGTGKIAATEKNYNNQIGLPCAILNADGNENYWILEAGISHEGDMDDLGNIAWPDLGIILNAGPGHTEGLGKMGVAWNKCRLLRYLTLGGVALVSADYPELRYNCELLNFHPHYFSTRKNGNAIFYIEDSDEINGRYNLYMDGDRYAITSSLKGAFGAELVIAAASAAHLCGIDKKIVKSALEHVEMPPQRFNHVTYNGVHIFDDSYNANPLSMQRMLESAAQFARSQNLPLILVLGEMGELGDEAISRHFELGKNIGLEEPFCVFWKGGYAHQVKEGLEKGGVEIPFINVESPSDFIDKYKKVNQGRTRCVVLFKGSRANHLENYLEAFKEKFLDEEKNAL